LIIASAERNSYGIRSKDSILYEDESENALYFWDYLNTAILPSELQKHSSCQR
jgi:hypothetical protein